MANDLYPSHLGFLVRSVVLTERRGSRQDNHNSSSGGATGGRSPVDGTLCVVAVYGTAGGSIAGRESGSTHGSDGEGYKELACDGRTGDQEECEKNSEGFIAGSAFIAIIFSGHRGRLVRGSVVSTFAWC